MNVFPKSWNWHIDNPNYQSLQQDINQGLEIFYARQEQLSDDNQDNHGINGWRQRFVQWAHLIPALCLTVDMLINKIKLRPEQVRY